MKRLQELLNARGASLTTDGIFGPRSLAALSAYINEQIQRRGWVKPIDGLVWMRTDQSLTNTFDDFVAVYKGGFVVAAAPASTTAGDHYIYNPITYGGITGTAVALEQQVLQSHRFVTANNWRGLWLNAPYFQQVKDIGIFRDGNRDRRIDKQITRYGNFGINLHRGGIGNVVNNWSAGCCVVPDNHWFNIVKLFAAGQTIDFTLIEM